MWQAELAFVIPAKKHNNRAMSHFVNMSENDFGAGAWLASLSYEIQTVQPISC